jgi:hypothetical protein
MLELTSKNRGLLQSFLPELACVEGSMMRFVAARTGGASQMSATSKRMLDGYLVLDFTQVLAGPTTTRYLAEMGADVIKLEFAPNGDISRAVPYLRDGRSGYYVQQNRGKKSLCLDLKNPAATEIIRELLPRSTSWSRISLLE